jgi:tetratricopeptide (TPR) repeat protein
MTGQGRGWRGRRWLIALGTLGAVGLAVAFVGVPWWVRHQVGAAEAALERPDFDEAHRRLERALQLRPRNARIHLLMAQVERRRGNSEAAERHLNESEQLQGTTPALVLERDPLRAQRGELPEVETSLRSALRKGTADSVRVLEALPQGYLAAGRAPEAVGCLDELLRLRPEHPRALAWRSQAWGRLNQWNQALAEASRATDLRPASDEARLCLAGALERLSRPAEAAVQYEWLVRRTPGNATAVLGLVRCLQDQAKLDTAQRVLDGFLANQPGHAGALVERGRLALRRGARAEAEGFLRRAVDLSPRDLDALRLLWLCLEAEGKQGDAARSGERLRHLEAVAGRLDRLAAAAAVAPDDPEPRCQLGILLLEEGRDEEALTWLAGVLELDPHHHAARQALEERRRQKMTGPRGGR